LLRRLLRLDSLELGSLELDLCIQVEDRLRELAQLLVLQG
jgi:hypothetical protein